MTSEAINRTVNKWST